MPYPPIQEIIKDPKFKRLPEQEKVRVFQIVDPNFSRMSAQDQNRVMLDLMRTEAEVPIPEMPITPTPEELEITPTPEVPIDIGVKGPQMPLEPERPFERIAALRPEERIEELPEELREEYIRPMPLKKVVSQAIKSTPRSAKEFVEDLISPFLHPKETAEAMAKLAKGVGQKLIPGTQEDEEIVDNMMEALNERYGGVENVKRTIARDPVGFVADISSILVPTGAVTRVAGVTKAGKVISRVGEVLEPTTVVRKITKEVVRKVIPEEMPTKLYQSAAKFTTTLPEKKRKAIAQTALDERIMPTLKGLDTLRDKVNTINSEITEMIDASVKRGEKIPIKALFTGLKELRKEKILTGEPLIYRRAIDNIAKQISIANKKIGREALTPMDVQKLKKNLYKETETLYSKTTQKPIKGETKQIIAKAAKESLEKIFPEIKNLNIREGSLIELRKQLEKSASRISNRDLLGIGVPIKGGAGGAVAGFPGLVGGAVLGLFDTPQVKAKLAIVTNSLKRKGVVLPEDSLMRQILEIAPGATAITARQLEKLREQAKKEK